MERGLSGVELIVSDDRIHDLVNHGGMRVARKAVFGSVSWQRCQFHLQQNAQAYVPKRELKEPVAADIRAVFNAPSLDAAEILLKATVKKYDVSAPKLALWLLVKQSFTTEENLFEGFTTFGLPQSHQRLLRTSNMVERVNKEVKRRTKVVTIFPLESSCLRLVSAVLMETSEDWEAGKAYLTFPEKKN